MLCYIGAKYHIVVTRKLNLFLRKSIKLLPPELLLLAQICTKSFVRWGFAPDPTGGAYSAPPNPLVGLRGPTSKGRGGKGREREGRGPTSNGRGDKEREGRGWTGKEGQGGEGKGEREGRKGMAGPIPNPLLRICISLFGLRPVLTIRTRTRLHGPFVRVVSIGL